jgi:hypothetical protein
MNDISFDPADFFSPVDGLNDPLLVLGFDESDWLAHQPRISLSAESLAIVEARRAAIQHLSLTWTDKRSLSEKPLDRVTSYERSLGIVPGSMSLVFRRIAAILGKEKISTLDYGCGQGAAIEGMQSVPCIDPLVGVTLDVSKVLDSVRCRIHAVDAIDVKPRNFSSLFDVVISVFGAAHYSVLNRRAYDPDLDSDQGDVAHCDLTFGVLQALHFLREDGFLFFATVNNDPSISQLISRGILEFAPELNDFSSWGRLSPNVYRFARRPDPYEIGTLLKLGPGNVYTITGS